MYISLQNGLIFESILNPNSDKMSSYITEANETLDYQTYDYSSKTIDLLGEEFVKREDSKALQTEHKEEDATMNHRKTSLPSLTYTTTTIPTISSGEEAGVLYYNLDDLSRYIPESFSFDMSENLTDNCLQIDHDILAHSNKGMTISIPVERGNTQSFSIQFKQTTGAPTTNGCLTIPTVDTTKLTGQLSVVQELPEVSKLVFQEMKQENDSIVNILENMKEEEDFNRSSPLDYTISNTETPLNLVNSQKGVKRILNSNAPRVETKRIKNLIVFQSENGHQTLLPEASIPDLGDLSSGSSDNMEIQPTVSNSTIDNCIVTESNEKNSSSKLTFPTKTIAGTVLPSSKTCNWIFENGQVCGKTFSKSYNLVVHMRMHEDIRPFACTLCDQTFRQKAHLQRHETTHGIQSKNFFRNTSGTRRRKRGNSKDIIFSQRQITSQKKFKNRGTDSEEEIIEGEEDIFVPHASLSKRKSSSESFSSPIYNVEDQECSNTVSYIKQKRKCSSFTELVNDKRDLKDGEIIAALNLAQKQVDDDTSTVQDILHTVNSVPTLEQKLESSFLSCESLTQKSRSMEPSSLSPVLYNNNNLPFSFSTTLCQNLPGSTYPQTNILYTTLAGSQDTNKKSSLVDCDRDNKNNIIIENLEDHSPEIQAELLNAFLADEPKLQDQKQKENTYQEEIYRLKTLPSSWWVIKKKKQGFSPDITYFSPQGLAFKTKKDIQDFLQHNHIPCETKVSELRRPPIPFDSIPFLDDENPSIHNCSPSNQHDSFDTHLVDTNSIAQVLIASLRPEPLENLQNNQDLCVKLNHTINVEDKTK